MTRWVRGLVMGAVLAGAPALLRSAETPPDTTAARSAARQADLAQFKTEFLTPDRSYAPRARGEAEARLTALAARESEMTDVQFELALTRIVGLADNGHTVAFPGPRSRRYNRVEIRLVPFEDGFYVLRATVANADLLGSRLVAIDGRPIDSIRRIARTLAGGTFAWRDRNAGYFFESPEQMNALRVIEESDAATYRFADASGKVTERRLVAEPARHDRPRANADRWLYPEPLAEEAGAWRSLLTPEQAPLAFREADVPFRSREAPEIAAFAIELRQNNDAGDQPIARFLAEMKRILRERKPRNLVLDMRMNGGGDLNTTRDFMQELPGLVPGRIFVLTSPWTFSAAISSVGYLKQAAPDRVTIVGEHVGDRMNFFAEGALVTLTHSGIALLNATERHDYLTGCRGMDDCHASVVRHPIAVPSLAPEIDAPWTLEAYRAGRDPGMEAIAAALRGPGTPSAGG